MNDPQTPDATPPAATPAVTPQQAQAAILRRNVEAGYSLGLSFTPLCVDRRKSPCERPISCEACTAQAKARKPGKKPTLRKWQIKAGVGRETLAQALAWAAAGNVGLRTGSASADSLGRGLLVVDLDATKPQYDAAAVKALNMPLTVAAITGSGGYHVYFRVPAGVELGNSVAKILPAVDTRCEGGQVVYPGSVHPDTGKPYTWAPERSPWKCEIAELPANLLAALQGQRSPDVSPAAGQQPGDTGTAAAQPPPAAANSQAATAADDRARRYALAALDREIQTLKGTTEGRNAALNSAAFALGQLVGGGLLQEQVVRAALLDCIPPQFRSQNAATIESGLSAGKAEPRAMPPSDPRFDRRSSSASSGQPVGGQSSDRAASDVYEGEGFVPLGMRDAKTRKLVLSASSTLPTAQAFVRQFHAHKSLRTIHSFTGLLLGWRDNRYRHIEDGEVCSRLLPWLHDAVSYDRDGNLERFRANPSTVSSALETVRAHVHLAADRDAPFWISRPPDCFDGAHPDPREILSCKSHNLHIPTGATLPASPDLLSYNALDFDFDPKAAQPATWIKFLGSLWPDDTPAIDMLQEWFGYCLTADTSQQKMLLIQGPPRSGKGTIGRILTELIGRANVAGPTTDSLGETFGLQQLIGKSVAIVSDARFSGPNIQTVIERLLVISGEDTITIRRMYESHVTMRLGCRMVFLSNPVPQLRDASSAIAARFLPLVLRTSFLGQEDLDLMPRLMRELPGILRWALAGWQRLHERGRFLVPESSREVQRLMFDMSSPVSEFVRDTCDLAADGRVWVDELYAAWKNWCEVGGRDRPGSRQSFGRDLQAAFPQLAIARNTHSTREGSTRYYVGVSLKGGLPGASEAPATATGNLPFDGGPS